MNPRSTFARLFGFAILIFGLPVTSLIASTFDYAPVERAIQERKFAWAQQELTNRLEAEPTDFRAHMLLGIVLDEQNQPADAARRFQKAVQLQPQSPAAHINLGKHAARVGDLAQATQEFEAAIRIRPRDPSGHQPGIGADVPGEKLKSTRGIPKGGRGRSPRRLNVAQPYQVPVAA